MSANSKRPFWGWLVGLCLLGGVCVFLVLSYWRASLILSVWEINSAVQKHDARKFQKYVDLNGLFSRMIDDSVGFATKQNSDDFATGIVNGMMALMKPQIVQNMISETIRAIESEKPQLKTPAEGEPKVSTPADVVSVENVEKYSSQMANLFDGALKKIKRMEKSGQTAILAFSFRPAGSNEDILIELKFRSMGFYWQLAEVTNFAEILKRNQSPQQTGEINGAASANKDDETLVEPVGIPTEEQQYLPNVRIEEVKVGQGYGQFDIPQYSPSKKTIFGKIRNVGSRPLSGVEIVVYFKNKQGQVISEKKYSAVSSFSLMGNSEPLKPNYVRDFGFIVENDAPSEWDGENVDVQISKIEFLK